MIIIRTWEYKNIRCTILVNYFVQEFTVYSLAINQTFLEIFSIGRVLSNRSKCTDWEDRDTARHSKFRKVWNVCQTQSLFSLNVSFPNSLNCVMRDRLSISFGAAHRWLRHWLERWPLRATAARFSGRFEAYAYALRVREWVRRAPPCALRFLLSVITD